MYSNNKVIHFALYEAFEGEGVSTISIHEVGYESLLFEKEENDETLVQTNILAHLPEPVVTTSVNYTDAEGNYYLYLYVSRDEIVLLQYEVWLINGEEILNILGGNDDGR
ncbi:hypothetical protein LBYS11_03030 [Lysinibacillus sp. YS11]|uniref:hypothetical protein n=1 Tax=Lysinibacillus sp. YS11 TaxID=2072025 RepID=UPI000CA21DC3|nr:hypothetical protein [Lysinibacillus sp. YS11]AUS85362.1 hypothetical protein LBYS11_03030 [Lysinibacillus sp. YS11]